MQFTVGVEYALHSLFYMVSAPEGKSIGIKQLAELHDSTDSYLSKIFAKLRKAGIVRSVSGVKGGYELARVADEISFWDIIEAVEGSSYFFQCNEMRKKNIFVDDPTIFTDKCPCLIKVVIQDAENLFRKELKAKSLRWLYNKVHNDFSDDKKRAIREWVNNI